MGSQMTLAGGADIVRGGEYCTIVSELELALPCIKTAQNFLPLLCLSEPVQWHRVEINLA